MSSCPENPWWRQDADVPIMIMIRLDWDEATESGYITAEHEMQRLKNVADHVFEQEAAAGFDGDGFVISLVAEGLPLPMETRSMSIQMITRRRMLTSN